MNNSKKEGLCDGKLEQRASETSGFPREVCALLGTCLMRIEAGTIHAAEL